MADKTFHYSLLIDTSSNNILISLNKNNEPIEVSRLNSNEEDLSSSLFPSIKNILEKHNINNSRKSLLSFISIGTGPGSYTGLRVGAAAAKSLAYGLEIPLIGFCSLKSFIPPINGPFFSVTDAQSGGVYLLEGIQSNSNVSYFKKPILVPLSEARTRLKNAVIATPHTDTLKKKISPESCKYFQVLPNPFHLANICFYKYENKNFNLLNRLELFYLRGPKPIAR